MLSINKLTIAYQKKVNRTQLITILTKYLSLIFKLLFFRRVIPQADSCNNKKGYIYFEMEFCIYIQNRLITELLVSIKWQACRI